jgi:hypothetical protein
MSRSPVLLPDGTKCWSGPSCKKHSHVGELNSRLQELATAWGVEAASPALEELLPKSRTVRRGMNAPGDERLEALNKASEEFEQLSLTEEERNALAKYSFTGYKAVNSYLRDGVEGLRKQLFHEGSRIRDEEKRAKYVERELPNSLSIAERDIALLDSAFEKVGRSRNPRLLFRSIHVKGVKNTSELDAFVEEKYSVGSVVEEKPYLSTSCDSDLMLHRSTRHPRGEHLVFEIVSKSNGLLLHDHTVRTGGNVQSIEREVLLPRGLKFRVAGVTSATYESTYPEGTEFGFRFDSIPKKKRMKVIQLVEV